MTLGRLFCGVVRHFGRSSLGSARDDIAQDDIAEWLKIAIFVDDVARAGQ